MILLCVYLVNLVAGAWLSLAIFWFHKILNLFRHFNSVMNGGRQRDVPPLIPDGGWTWMVAIGASVVQMQVATLATTFGMYFANLTTGPRQRKLLTIWSLIIILNTRAMPASLVSTVPSIMVCVSFFFCPISSALSKVSFLDKQV